jgi:hypothetical protein
MRCRPLDLPVGECGPGLSFVSPIPNFASSSFHQSVDFAKALRVGARCTRRADAVDESYRPTMLTELGVVEDEATAPRTISTGKALNS